METENVLKADKVKALVMQNHKLCYWLVIADPCMFTAVSCGMPRQTLQDVHLKVNFMSLN